MNLNSGVRSQLAEVGDLPSFRSEILYASSSRNQDEGVVFQEFGCAYGALRRLDILGEGVVPQLLKNRRVNFHFSGRGLEPGFLIFLVLRGDRDISLLLEFIETNARPSNPEVIEFVNAVPGNESPVC